MEPNNEKILPINITDEVKKSFISYAMAVNISRALPDVCDGLKPVHRRILYSMSELGVTYDKPHRKCARIVGDVLGKYHPHGDTAVYDALVRLAQNFSIREPLVDGQGNFGSVDGDGAAAMRYTEARLSKISNELLRDIDKETVDFYPNFDNTLMQPKVLPSRFPNLLVNGSDGIAVGMATNIPPHNLREVIDGAVAMLDNPDISSQELIDYISGPDFPTGGMIMGKSGIFDAYTTGRGKIIVRARAEIETTDSGRNRIIVTEIPYQVNKAMLVERIADLVREKKVDGITGLRDESNRDGMRIVIELRRDVNPQIILNTLYKHTQMQETFGVIMLALVDGEPRILNLREMLYYYLRHQKNVIKRRTQYDLEKALSRVHLIEGLLLALDKIDAVIALIRASKDGAEAKAGLMQNFALSEKQAQEILNMRLQRLTGLERDKLQNEYDALMKDIAYYREILGSEELVCSIIKQEMLEIKEKYGSGRKAEIVPATDDIDLADLIDEHEAVITMTHFGYVKRLPSDTYRAQKRGGKGVAGLTTREEDSVERLIVTSSHSELLFFTNYGKAYSLYAYHIPEAGRTAKGTAIVNLLQLAGGEKVSAVLPMPKDAEGYLMLATKRGTVKKTDISEFSSVRRNGLIAINLTEGDELIGVELTSGGDEILIGTKKGMSIRFEESDVRPMGRISQGVRGIMLDKSDEVVGMERVQPDMKVLTITENGYGKRSDIDDYRVQYRGGKGIIAHDINSKTGLIAGFKIVDDTMDIMLITDTGTIIRTPISDIRLSGRNTQGVRMMRVGDNIKVAAITAVPVCEEDSESSDNGQAAVKIAEEQQHPSEDIQATASNANIVNDTSLERLLERAAEGDETSEEDK